jgi:hypothetical protein
MQDPILFSAQHFDLASFIAGLMRKQTRYLLPFVSTQIPSWHRHFPTSLLAHAADFFTRG